MKQFEDDFLYKTDDPALAILATRSTLAVWRHQGRGPKYLKYGQRVFYRGSDLTEFLSSQLVVVKPRNN